MSAFSGGDAVQDVDGEALDWALRMADPDADWEAFTTWLEGDPNRAARYDNAVMALDQAARAVAEQAAREPVPPEPMIANDRDPPMVEQTLPRRGRRAWLSGAVAAALAGAVGLNLWSGRDETYTVATRPGEQRTVELADGSSIVLAGGSRVRLDAARPRSAVVEAGEMLFTVRHDADVPFRVHARDLTLVDLGTVFDVRMIGSRTRVAVAEGAVMVGRDGAALRLDPGQAVVSDGATLRRERQDAADIGLWREGLLIFNDATLNDVAEELSRNLGLRITAAPAVQRRAFNGTLEVAALRRDPALLGSLLDVDVRRDGDGWTLDARR